jgi:hypothetical protein
VNLTNDEVCHGIDAAALLKWMRRNGVGVPATGGKCNTVVYRFLAARRRNMYRAVRKELATRAAR